MSIEIAEQLAEFAQRGNQQRIYLKNGQMLQGWIMEINENALMISTGFAEKTGKDQWIEFADINLNQLEYWDSQVQMWSKWQLPDAT